MHKISSFIVKLALLLIITMHPLYAGIYKWVDKDGNVHFGDRPANNSASEIKISPTKPNSINQQRIEKQNQYLKDRQQARDEKKKQRKAAKKKKKEKKRACQKMQKYLTKLEEHARLYRNDKEGARYYLSGPERDAAIVKARNKIKRKKCR